MNDKITLIAYIGLPFDYLIRIGNEDGVIDLSGFVFLMKIRPSLESDIVYQTLSTDNGRISLTTNLGEIRVFMNAVETAAIATDGVFDIIMTTPSRQELLFYGSKIRRRLIASREL